MMYAEGKIYKTSSELFPTKIVKLLVIYLGNQVGKMQDIMSGEEHDARLDTLSEYEEKDIANINDLESLLEDEIRICVEKCSYFGNLSSKVESEDMVNDLKICIYGFLKKHNFI